MNAQPSVDRRQGRLIVAWTTDADGELATNGDRRIAVADCSQGPCEVAVPAQLPAGADSPSVALPGPDKIHLAFLHRGKDGDGVTDTGIGNQAKLWVAEYGYHGTAWNWLANPVTDRWGHGVRAERPRLSTIGDNITLVLFRRFGKTGTTGYMGQLALTKMVANGLARPPIYLTSGLAQHWQAALAINQVTRQAVILSVSRAPSVGSNLALARQLESLAPVTQAAMPTSAVTNLSTAGDPVESVVLEAGPDPALDPALALSQQHPAPGSTVAVTATVRNVGRELASGLQVTFYAGSPSSGTLLETVSVPGDLDLNESKEVAIDVVAGGGSQPLSAEVTTTGDDVGAGNNTASADLGELPPPEQVQVAASNQLPGALQVTWQPPAVPYVAGYRILRSDTAGGPYELVGQATGYSYADLLLQPGQDYYYVVQAFDAAGVWSENSSEASGQLPKYEVYLPAVSR
jgi:hypothetical protein